MDYKDIALEMLIEHMKKEAEEKRREQDYKSRIEKAIDYMENVQAVAEVDKRIIFSANILLDILKGIDKK